MQEVEKDAAEEITEETCEREDHGGSGEYAQD